LISTTAELTQAALGVQVSFAAGWCNTETLPNLVSIQEELHQFPGFASCLPDLVQPSGIAGEAAIEKSILLISDSNAPSPRIVWVRHAMLGSTGKMAPDTGEDLLSPAAIEISPVSKTSDVFCYMQLVQDTETCLEDVSMFMWPQLTT